MRRKSIKQNSGDNSDVRRYGDQNQDQEGTQGNGKGMQFNTLGDKKSCGQYKCGKAECGKLYHSYTAFYNHCKKSHQGIFPANSLYNGKPFEGPSKNRGRPRIKKTDVKDSIQIQSLKTQNQLIQFLGTLPKKKKNQELIVYVANAIEQLESAIQLIVDLNNNENYNQFLTQLVELNKVVSLNDLPDFYDPIEIHNFSDKMDSYNFLSMYNFLINQQKIHGYKLTSTGVSFMRKIMVIWLTRILSVPLLAEVIYTVAQINQGVQKIDQRQYMQGKTLKFRQLIQKYFECILNQQSNTKVPQNKQEFSQ